MPDALPAATLPIYPGVGRAQEYAGLHTPWLGFLEICFFRNLFQDYLGPVAPSSVNFNRWLTDPLSNIAIG